MKTPTPKHVETICSVCGLDWKRHGKAPTLETCVELLKKELAAKPAPVQPIPMPYPVPYPISPQPYPRPYRPWPNYPGGPSWISQPQTISGQISGSAGVPNPLARAS